MNAIKKWNLDGKEYYITVKKTPPHELNGGIITIVYGSDKDGRIYEVSTYSEKRVYEEIAKMEQDSRERNWNLTPELRALGFEDSTLVVEKKEISEEEKAKKIERGIDSATRDYLERSGQRMFYSIAMSPENRDLYEKYYSKAYKGIVITGNEKCDNSTIAVGGFS